MSWEESPSPRPRAVRRCARTVQALKVASAARRLILIRSCAALLNDIRVYRCACILEGIETVRAAGKVAGILTPDRKLARTYLDAGALFVAVGTDTSLLIKGALELAAHFKTGAKAAPAAPARPSDY